MTANSRRADTGVLEKAFQPPVLIPEVFELKGLLDRPVVTTLGHNILTLRRHMTLAASVARLTAIALALQVSQSCLKQSTLRTVSIHFHLSGSAPGTRKEGARLLFPLLRRLGAGRRYSHARIVGGKEFIGARCRRVHFAQLELMFNR